MPKYEGSTGGGGSYNKNTGEVRTSEQNARRKESNRAKKASKESRGSSGNYGGPA